VSALFLRGPMLAEWQFWAIAVAVVIGSLAIVFAPLMRGATRGTRRSSYDMQVFRDQLREIHADLARGVLGAEEAEATRVEVSRRLLAAADAEAAERAAATAPRLLSRRVAAAAVLVLAAATAGLYGLLGASDLPDQPHALRLAQAAAAHAARPRQAEVEAAIAREASTVPDAGGEDAALVARLREVLKARPDDLQGHRLLARSLAALARWPQARAAQARVVELLGDGAAAQDLVDLAELSILAANGYVSPEAEAALARALTMEPANPVGRYYSGVALLQGGRPDLAYPIWSALLAEGPSDAPWIAPIGAGIDEVARMAGLPPRAPGPGTVDVAVAGRMAPDEPQAMVEGMVAQLSDRLASDGGPPADWARLVRSLGVLGRRDEAAAILAEARGKHAGDAAALAELNAAARDAGLQ
jgi:cytochrome c-type biogenesis protein CcmH